MKNKILIIDDSVLQRKFMGNVVRDAGGTYEILEAGGGNEAIDLLGRQFRDIGLILCDWNMPDLSGIEFIEAVASVPKLADLPLVMVTSRIEDTDKKEAFKKHPRLAGYLEKPFSPKILQTYLSRYLA